MATVLVDASLPVLRAIGTGAPTEAEAVPDVLGDPTEGALLVMAGFADGFPLFAAFLVGSAVALFENNLKRLLAYSSVAQIGYILLGVSMVTVAGQSAGVLHMFNHALSKGALFLAVMCLSTRLPGLHLADLAGAARRMPWTMAALVVGGLSLIGVPGTADRLFGALKDAGVSVTLISQASSEHSICIAVPREVAGLAGDVIRAAFAEELDSGQIQRVEVSDEQSIVAVVGDGMAGTPGVAARFFGTLGRAGINVRAIAQGSSERNISAVVDADELHHVRDVVGDGAELAVAGAGGDHEVVRHRTHPANVQNDHVLAGHRVGLAGQQELLESLRPAKRIGALEHLEDRRGP